jgi:hypothetical protein
MINVTLDDKRGGTVSAPFYARAIERVTINGADVPDGATVAVMTTAGDALAVALVADNAATIDLNTVDAAGATEYLGAGELIDCALVIGDTDTVIAVVPIKLGANTIDDLAPPTQMAPTYPTWTELDALLFQCEEAVRNVKKWATDAQNQASTALSYVQQSANNANLASQAQQQAQLSANKAKASEVNAKTTETRITRAEERINSAVTSAEQYASNARDAVTEATNLKNEVDRTSKAVSGIKAEIDATKSAIDGTKTDIDATKASIDDTASAVEQAKTDAEGFKKDAEGFAKTASESAVQASKSAEGASKSAQDAQTTADSLSAGLATLNGLDGRVEANEEKLSQIPLSQKITYRDVLGELTKANGWSDVSTNAVIKRIATTSNGNIVVIYQNYNTSIAIYVLSQSGERLAQQSLPNLYAFAQITRIHLVDYNGEIFVLTDGICYSVADTQTSATISEIGTIDFNGLATQMPNLYELATSLYESTVITISDRALIGRMVIDLTNLKVIQILSSYPIFAYGYTHGKTDTAIVTLSNNKVAYLTLNENGLIDIKNDTVHTNAYFVTKGSDTCGWMKQTNTGLCDFSIMRKNESIVFNSTKCLEFFKGRIVSRGNAFCGITNDGRIAYVGTSTSTASFGVNPSYVFAKCDMSSVFHMYRIIGIDQKGAWFLSKAFYVWAGFHPIAPLIRVTF